MEYLALENSSLAEQDLLLSEIKQEIEDIEDEVNNLQSVMFIEILLVESWYPSDL